jgi:FAD/FMN-containing dehydrogenase
MGDPLVRALRDTVGDAHTLTDPDVIAPFETDWTGRFSGRARLVVRPGDSAEVAEVMRVCAAEKAPVVPQGGNTGLVGGSVPRDGEVVISLTRLAALEEVDASSAQVAAGAGTTIAALQTHAAAAGLAYGVDLAARDSATLGGTIATNAGGVNVLRHGATRSQVVGVEAVLADGRVLSRMQGLAKDSTGYDLPGLLTGSEGTLGIITRARVRLVPAPIAKVVALLGVDSTGDALRVLAAVRHLDSLHAAEWFHRDGLDLVREHTGFPDPLRQSHPTYLLLECAAAEDPFEPLAGALASCALAGDVAVATDRADRERLWGYRERHTEALAAAGVPSKYDVGIPPEHLERFEHEARALCAERGSRLFLFGHLAEGNVHANVLGDGEHDESLDDAMLRLVASLGGSISAEHGVGTAKVKWMELTRDATDRAAMAAVKRALDPEGLLNPGVLFALEALR